MEKFVTSNEDIKEIEARLEESDNNNADNPLKNIITIDEMFNLLTEMVDKK
jgi:hypothetical protein